MHCGIVEQAVLDQTLREAADRYAARASRWR
jgi:hypothetical protein